MSGSMIKELNKDYMERTLKRREKDSNKGTYGTLTIVGGSSEYRGAALLNAMGALRSGAGIVRLASVGEVTAAAASKYPSLIFCDMKKTPDGRISSDNISEIIGLCRKSRQLLMGSGLGVSADICGLVNSVLESVDIPMVLDADALNSLVLSGNIDGLKKCKRKPIVTPHVGEMARLSGKTIDEIKANPMQTALEFAKRYNCIVVLKDSKTYVADPIGEIFLSEKGNPGLAKGGSGDVLSGLIAGMLVQGYTQLESAALGVVVHGMAADLCASEKSMQAMQPYELDDYICRVLRESGY